MTLERKTVALFGVITVGLVVAIGAGPVYRFFNPYLDQSISGPVIASTEWLEITPKVPLRAQRQIQRVMIDIAEPLKPDYKASVMHTQDGMVIILEVQLVDEGGRTYPLDHIGMDETGMAFFMPELPRDTSFGVVRIRANRPIKLSRIYWHCYNQWDVS
jgi:hypothetical protein